MARSSSSVDGAPANQASRISASSASDVLRSESASTFASFQRRVLVAVALQDVPIDVLAERLDTTRGALYKTIHDARRKLRAALAAREMS